MQGTANARSQELLRNLAITDNLRELVSSIKRDTKFKTKLASNVPQIVVVGMQSAGKSTTLELLSGVQFPQSATMCTRVPIELKLRRGQQLPTRVTLKGPDGYTESFESNDTTKNIKDAQDKAVEVSGQAIARDYCVEIVCQAEDKVNVTLVDLPGFFAPKTTEHQGTADMVKKLGEDYAQMKNSLVLHVMGIDQDYGNVLTKITVSELDESKVINVFTKPDLLVNQGSQEAEERLNDFLSETSAPRFVVCGKFTSNQSEEVSFIKGLGLFQDDTVVKLGSGELAQYLEDRICEHLTQLLPEFRAELVKDMKDVSTVLETVYKQPRADEILQSLGMDIQTTWPVNAHNRKVRLLCEKMRIQIRQCRIEPLNKKGGDVPLRQAESDELEIGDSVWIPSEEEEDTSTKRVVGQITEKTIVLDDETEIDNDEVQILDLTLALVDEVLDIMNQRGLTNAQFFDPQLVLDTYMSRFADMYGVVLTNVAHAAHKLTVETTRAMFGLIEVPAAGLKVREVLESEILESCNQLLLALLVSANRVIRFCKPPLVYTTNDHYLAQNIRKSISSVLPHLDSVSKVVKASQNKIMHPTSFQLVDGFIDALKMETHAPTDRSAMVDAAKKIIITVEAFWKVKVKMITEYFASELSLVFCVEIQEAIKRIAIQVQKHVEHVVETQSVKVERARFQERKRILETALALF